jgi:hypothetical protein
MTAAGTIGPDGRLVVPAPIEVVPSEHADAVLEAAQDELTVLRLELAAVEDELRGTRARLAGTGVDGQVVDATRARLESIVQGIHDEAARYGAAAAAAASATAAEVLRRAEEHAEVLRSGRPFVAQASPTVVAPPPAALGVAPEQGSGWMVPAAAVGVPPGWVVVPQGARPAPPGGRRRDRRPPREPYAATLGMLQVVTWSILVATVLVVALAWFA